MKIYYTDQFEFPLPPDHPFPVEKYRQVRKELEKKGLIPPEDFRVPTAAGNDQIGLVHSSDYIERFSRGLLTPREIRRIGLPWSRRLVERSRRSVGGTLAACRAALEEGIAIYLGGGTHHAARDHGEGFCVFNDVAIACRTLQKEDEVRRVVILDCDVHQGNGTASIFKDDPDVFTFSIHGRKNFPYRKTPGHLDIGLEDGTGDEEYLELLQEGVERSLALSHPNLAIYLAGADPFKQDCYGRLRLTKKGLAERDRVVIELCKRETIPLAIVLSGGYARDIRDSVAIHVKTVELACAASSCCRSQPS